MSRPDTFRFGATFYCLFPLFSFDSRWARASVPSAQISGTELSMVGADTSACLLYGPVLIRIQGGFVDVRGFAGTFPPVPRMGPYRCPRSGYFLIRVPGSLVFLMPASGTKSSAVRVIVVSVDLLRARFHPCLGRARLHALIYRYVSAHIRDKAVSLRLFRTRFRPCSG